MDDEDRKLIAKRRGDANRLGFALQLTTVRSLGTFLDDPLDVPSAVLDELAAQLGIVDASCVKTYVERANTRWVACRHLLVIFANTSVFARPRPPRKLITGGHARNALTRAVP
ncbi:MAG: DUF4158 domain-containing protein [Pseudonocardiaceae bacterium]